MFILFSFFFSSAPRTHHNTVGHEEHHPTEDMNHEEGYRQPAQVIIPTAAKDIPVTCNTAKSHKWQIAANKKWQLLFFAFKLSEDPVREECIIHVLIGLHIFIPVPPASCSPCSTSVPSAPCWLSIASSSLSRRWGVLFGQHGISFSRYIRNRTAMGTGSCGGGGTHI